jgi:hypothetical protein
MKSDNENKINKMKNKTQSKTLYVIDAIIILGSMFAMFTALGYFGYLEPLVIAPTDDLVTMNSSVLFSFERADVIYIDDNINFTSPEKIFVENDLEVKLSPGVYYWKIEGVFESEIRRLTILSHIGLKLKESGYEYYEVVNAGNIALNVEVYDENDTHVGDVRLDVDESGKVGGSKFIGVGDE